jgi:hypothetical protein
MFAVSSSPKAADQPSNPSKTALVAISVALSDSRSSAAISEISTVWPIAQMIVLIKTS